MTAFQRILCAGIAIISVCETPAWAGTLTPSQRYERLAPWSDFVAEAATKTGLPRVWIEAVILAESGGRTVQNGRPITSSKGAMGLMQLMPATYSDLRTALNLGADPYDPHDNILAGATYLRAMYDRFGYPGMFAAYNAGPGRYQVSLGGQRLPVETQNYLAELTQSRSEIQSGLAIFVGQAPASPTPPAPERSALFVPLSGSKAD